jgi:hypothetical protein
MLALLIFISHTFAFEKIYPDQLSFEYVPSEFESTSCTHQEIKPIQDFKVHCKGPYLDRIFIVHPRLRVAKRGQDTWIELLYWVTNRIDNNKVSEFTGTTLNMKLIGHSDPYTMRVGQAVDNDYAHLQMTLTRP